LFDLPSGAGVSPEISNCRMPATVSMARATAAVSTPVSDSVASSTEDMPR
jgi:hypothetical protein